MKAFAVFTKKELTESLRTYRLAVLLAVFALLGIMSPLTAKMLPDILGAIDLGGMTLNLPEPTAMDSWTQFFKNVGQMGVLALIIIFSGIMASEFSRGTLVNLLAKGLRRETVILAKFTAATLLWTLAYLLCLGVAASYTAYYWEIELQNAPLAFGGMWLFGELLIALLILGGTLFANFYGSLLLTGGVTAVLSVLGIVPKLAKYNPISLSGGTLALLDGQASAGDFVTAVVICALCVVALLAASLAVFRRKRV
ncbi:MAG: ABC transporter permease [Propionibacteriaceae bacterium]|jgi:ABC-2 type transport system permease protein|nr:ABC transporter permease [Propionibacteriaceae bacterium]